ncbi:MAG: flagellar biosynthetic protein FliO [Candidatus Marinimicrobia bacterium]|nr:flagellar biosynthetic protein FliO [Candidatus Neomarinimicrobiota bacterium]
MRSNLLSNNNSQKKRGNLLLAAIFFAIALIGILMMVNNPSYENLSQKTIEDTIKVSEESIVGNQAGKEINFYTFILKTMLITGIIIILILIIARFIKIKGFKNSTFGQNIKIIGRKYLSPKQYLLIIDVYGKKILLGVTEHSINKLDEFEVQDEFSENSISDAKKRIEGNIIEKINLKKRQDDKEI